MQTVLRDDANPTAAQVLSNRLLATAAQMQLMNHGQNAPKTYLTEIPDNKSLLTLRVMMANPALHFR